MKTPGPSSYFQGGYQRYGRYQWNIKYYGYKDDYEIDAAREWAFGDNFECVDTLLGRKIDVELAGRSGGWFVINTELTPSELDQVDQHIKSLMNALPEFLKEERIYQEENVK